MDWGEQLDLDDGVRSRATSLRWVGPMIEGALEDEAVLGRRGVDRITSSRKQPSRQAPTGWDSPPESLPRQLHRGDERVVAGVSDTRPE